FTAHLRGNAHRDTSLCRSLRGHADVGGGIDLLVSGLNSIFEMDGLCIDAPDGGGTMRGPRHGCRDEETFRMIRFWTFAILGLACVCTIGCGEGGNSAIYAAAPDANFSTHYTVQGGGRFTLFRVTSWKKDGQPAATERVAS